MGSVVAMHNLLLSVELAFKALNSQEGVVDLELVLSLMALTTVTSTIAGICGMGGGLILVACLPFFVPVHAVIPLHGAIQFASNGSRLSLNFKHVHWPFFLPFLIGSIFGVMIFGWFITEIDMAMLPLFIGSYLLLSLWVKPIASLLGKIENFYLAGFLQTGVGLFVGAPGPVTVNLLSKRLASKDSIIATGALMLGISSISKIVVFLGIGFVFSDYLFEMIFAITGAFIGTVLGNKLRHKISQQHFMLAIKLLLTGLALRMLFVSLS